MKILFYYPSINYGGQQVQNLNILKTIKAEYPEIDTYFLYNFGDELFDGYNKVTNLLKYEVQYYNGDYKKKPWIILKMLFGLLQTAKSKKVDVIISGHGLGSLICGIVSRLIRISHYRIIGCSLAQVEKTLYRFYNVIMIDKLIDGYFGWDAVFDELSYKGVSKKKFHHINSAVDTSLFVPISDSEVRNTKNQFAIPENSFVIGWVGRVARNMQITYTYELFKRLVNRGYTNCFLVVVGGGEWFDELKIKTYIDKLDHVTLFTNWVDQNTVVKLLNCMDVVPLLEPDPQGGSIVREAMSCGRIALSVNGKSGTQATFMKEGTSILVDSDHFIENACNCIIKIIEGDLLIQDMGKNARSHAVKELSFSKQVSKIINTISSGTNPL